MSQKYDGLKYLSECVSNVLLDDDIEVFLKLYLLMYADDTLIFAESEPDLQKALNEMSNYCSLWKLTVNPTKTKVVIFGRGKTRNKPVFTYSDAPIEVVDDFIYLGVKLNSNSSYKKEQVYASEQANKSLYSIISKSRQLNLDLDLQIDLFDKVVMPVALYGSETWGAYGCEIVSRVQLKYYKYVLKLNRNTSTNVLLGELGKLPMSEVIKKRVLNYWFRIITCTNRFKLTSIMYKLMSQLYKPDGRHVSGWVNFVKQSLDELGLSFIWLTQDSLESCHFAWFKDTVCRRINDQFVANWRSKIEDSISCSNYKLYKGQFECENYLKELPPPPVPRNCHDQIQVQECKTPRGSRTIRSRSS